MGADHPYLPLLRTVPGIAWVLGYTIAAEIGDIGRFASAKKLAGYTGLCPIVRQSGGRDDRGPLAKNGPKYLRWTLIEAATHAARHPAYKDRYERTKKRLGRQRGSKVARVDIARELPTAIWHMLTRNEPFAPGRSPAPSGRLTTLDETEAQQLFVLDATEIARDFQVGSGDRANYFPIPAMKVFRSGRYEVASQTLMLDRIERAILEADRPTRSSFFGVVAPPEVGTLDSDYTIPLANWYGDFGDALREVKQGIRAAMYDMEDALAVFRKILASGDPVEAEVLLDESAVRDFLGHGSDQSLGFRFGSHSVLNEDLFGAARDFRRRLDRLRAAGLEVQYVRLFAEIDGAVQRSLRRRPPTPAGRSLSWNLTYDPVALSFGGLTVRTLKRPTLAPWPTRPPVPYLEDHPVVSPGKVVAVRSLGQFPPDPPAPRRLIPVVPWTPPTWKEFVQSRSRWVSEPLARFVEAEHFGDDL